MKTIDFPERASDPVISEVRAIKRQIVAEHGGDLDSFFSAIRQRQNKNPCLLKTTIGEKGAEQPATHPESDSKDGGKPQADSEERTR